MLKITHISLYTISCSYLRPEYRQTDHKVNEWQTENCNELIKVTKNSTRKFQRNLENKIP